jgi:hypothetical protein
VVEGQDLTDLTDPFPSEEWVGGPGLLALSLQRLERLPHLALERDEDSGAV